MSDEFQELSEPTRQAGEAEITAAVLNGIKDFKDTYTRVEFNLFQDECLWLAECVSRQVLARLQSPSPPADASDVMIVYDVQTLPNGEVVVGKPYRRFPDGTVAALGADQ